MIKLSESGNLSPAIFRQFSIALFAAVLFLPFKGIEASAIFFAIIFTILTAISLSKERATGYWSYFEDKFSAYTAETAGFRNFSIYLSLLLFASFPFILKDYYLDVLIIAGIYVILALGLNIIVGFAGLLNLGYAAFYAIGAYTYAILNTEYGLGFWITIPFSAGLATVAGVVLSVPALRLRGDYLAIVTLGFGEIVRLVLNNWDSLTNGPNGISGISPPYLFGISLGKLNYYYFIVLTAVVLCVFVIRRVVLSKTGRAWIAIRDNEIAASAMGIDTTRYKLYASAFGTFWAGVAGSLFAAKMQFVSPESFTFIESVLILSMVILGGLGNIYGAVIGAFILVVLPELLREVQQYRMLLLGAGLVLLMIFRPHGILGYKK